MENFKYDHYVTKFENLLFSGADFQGDHGLNSLALLLIMLVKNTFEVTKCAKFLNCYNIIWHNQSFLKQQTHRLMSAQKFPQPAQNSGF